MTGIPRPLAAFALATLLSACGSGGGAPAKAPVDLVNPFIGSGGHYFGYGSVFPGACVPFSLAKPGPDTSEENGITSFHHFSGYHADDTIIDGFSQVHISGTGANDYGALALMPTVGFDVKKTYWEGYRAHFSKANEKASPGYYAVTFDDPAIEVELTATARCAFHRYTYPAGTTDAVVVVDLAHAIPGCSVSESGLQMASDGGGLTGWLVYQGALTGRSGGYKLFFDLVLDRPATAWTVWRDLELIPGALSAEGATLGVALQVDTTEPVQVRIGLSTVDAQGARQNRLSEINDKTFQTVQTEARLAWEKALAKVQIQGGSEEEQVKFYSALYHLQLHPTLQSDGDGRYTGFDKQIHQAQGFDYYTDLSLWDTYRSVHSLFVLIDPVRQRDFVRSLLLMFEQGGYLPRWPAGTGESASMIGTPADVIIADSVIKGIRDFDLDLAWRAIMDHADTDRPSGRTGIESYLSLGYVPSDERSGAASLTLEIAVADGAVASLARALGKDADATRFSERARNYKNLWDPGTHFLRGRKADGSWAEADADFDPLDFVDSYVEGDAWQYLWLAPQDPAGLVELFGGAGPMADKLEEFFATPEPEDPLAEFLPKRYYWHGNEPDLHAAYLFDEVGRPDRAAFWVRQILGNTYGAGPDGLPGNDDLGAMSAWFVFSAAGFYPNAGQEGYWIGSPLFEEIRFDLGDGKIFTVKARGVSAEAPFIQSAELNGAALDGPAFRHADLHEGGTLELTMGSEPSSWGR